MPELEFLPEDCQKHSMSRWGYEHWQTISDDSEPYQWYDGGYLQSKGAQYTDWQYSVKSEYDKQRRLARVFRWCGGRREALGSRAFRKHPRYYKASKSATERLRSKFTDLAAQWRRETKFSSSVDDKVMHSAYQSIIAMGRSAVPLVLEELESRRGHWFWGLHLMTGVDPVPPDANIDAARDAWLKWGRQQGHITE